MEVDYEITGDPISDYKRFVQLKYDDEEKLRNRIEKEMQERIQRESADQKDSNKSGVTIGETA